MGEETDKEARNRGEEDENDEEESITGDRKIKHEGEEMMTRRMKRN